MKFVISAVVMLALALGAQSSLIAGLPGHHLGLGYAATIAHPAPFLAHGAWLGAHAHALPAAVNIAHGHAIYPAAHIPAAVAVHAAPHHAAIAAIPAHGATYVAKTRGAVHTAPLAGHVHSAASINLAPAPGTW